MFKILGGEIKCKLIKIAEWAHLKFFGHLMSNTMREFLADLSFVTMGMIISSIVIFFIQIVGARILGFEQYGMFQLIFIIAEFMLVPMLFGFNTAVVKYLPAEKSTKSKEELKNVATSWYLLLLSLFVVLLWLWKDTISYFVKVDKYTVQLAIVLAFFMSLWYFGRALLQGLQKMHFLTKMELIRSIVILVLFIFVIGIIHSNSYQYLYLIFTSAYLIIVIFTFTKIDIVWRIRWSDFKIVKKLFNYAKYAILGGISGALLTSVDKVVLNIFGGTKEVGIYSTYLLLSTMIFVQFINIFITVFFPKVNALENKKSVVDKVNIINKAIFPIFILTSVFIMYSAFYFVFNGNELSWQYIFLFALNTGLMGIYQLKMWLLNSEGIAGIRVTVKGVMIAGISNLILNLILIPHFMIYGAIISTIISNTILWVYMGIQVNSFFIYSIKNE